MKLHDCECGGSPHITVEEKSLYIVSCPICGGSTPEYDNLRSAQLVWNTWSCKQGYRTPENATA